MPAHKWWICSLFGPPSYVHSTHFSLFDYTGSSKYSLNVRKVRERGFWWDHGSDFRSDINDLLDRVPKLKSTPSIQDSIPGFVYLVIFWLFYHNKY